ncbi:YcgN family cysteine cluster protein [Frigidibacter sp. ROC022]|uniref:YcgN family cysteine cluster protein n=1 Tax=Frigidibacter sp. ROC022 TaxID=2971796 RepID=UPI00215A6817|nr:YcgN family cysteine cluster protein [Frigidibacter sp. ROC022]MCR8722941.1 YcgN family cysteine cluster protein [Frigidibacter sp. ROC022]
MKDPIPRDNLRPRYWESVKLRDMTPREWEALCDGCGKCCLNKLEDPDTGEVSLTRLACRLFDDETCRCGNYEIRKSIVPECVILTARTIGEHAYWMPSTCAYRLLHEGKPLPAWHPLLTGRADSVFEANVSAQGITIPEYEVPEEDWEDYIIEEPV